MEPRFFTFRSFSNFGKVTEQKLTNQNFDELSDSMKDTSNTELYNQKFDEQSYSKKVPDDSKFNVAKNTKLAKHTEKVFTYMV